MNLVMTIPPAFESSGNSRSSSKPFRISLDFLRSKSSRPEVSNRTSLSQLKLQLELSVQDIYSADAERLRYKIRGAQEVTELWMLRSDAHQVISRQFNQQEAAERINALLPCFEGWMPAKSLVKI